MASRRSFLILSSLCAFTFAIGSIGSMGCGGSDAEQTPETEPAVRGLDPPCGTGCPSTCFAWVRPSGNSKIVTLWIFDADKLDETALRAGQFDMRSSSQNHYTPNLSDILPMTIPSTVQGTWTVPVTMNPYAGGVTSKLLMGAPNYNEDCGIQIDN